MLFARKLNWQISEGRSTYRSEISQSDSTVSRTARRTEKPQCTGMSTSEESAHSSCQHIDIDLALSGEQLTDGAKKLLKKVRPNWNEVNIKIFTGGISNSLVGGYEKQYKFEEADDIVLIRVYGVNTDLIIDRENEKQSFLTLQKYNLSPPLYASFNNGLCYGYFHGSPIDGKMVRHENIQQLFIEEIVRFHTVSLNSKAECGAHLFQMIKKYMRNIPDQFTDPVKQKKYTEQVKPKSVLYNELDQLEKTLSSLPSPVVFCHNDLLLNNIIYNKANEKVKFIDFEYACPNFAAYDIANHFCEYAGVDEYVSSNYPDKTYQLNWLRRYLECLNKEKGLLEKHVSEKEIETLYVTVNKFALASHFLWGVWSLVQSYNSLIDFDFLGYSIIRLNDYFARKEEFLALKLPE